MQTFTEFADLFKFVEREKFRMYVLRNSEDKQQNIRLLARSPGQGIRDIINAFSKKDKVSI